MTNATTMSDGLVDRDEFADAELSDDVLDRSDGGRFTFSGSAISPAPEN